MDVTVPLLSSHFGLFLGLQHFFCTCSSKVKTTFKRKHEWPLNGQKQGLTGTALQNRLKDSYHPQDLLLNLTELKKKKKEGQKKV